MMKKGLYYLLYGFLWLLSLLPLWVHYVIADVICVLVYHVVGYRKALVRRNLTDSFPNKSAEELRAIEKAFYHWFCDYLVETVKLLTISRVNRSLNYGDDGYALVFARMASMKDFIEAENRKNSGDEA